MSSEFLKDLEPVDEEEIILPEKNEEIPNTSDPSSAPQTSDSLPLPESIEPIGSKPVSIIATSSPVIKIDPVPEPEPTRTISVKDKIKLLSETRTPSTPDSAPKFGGAGRNPSTSDSAPKFGGASRNLSTTGVAPKFENSNRSLSTASISNQSSSRAISTTEPTSIPSTTSSTHAPNTVPDVSNEIAPVVEDTSKRVTSVKEQVKRISETKKEESKNGTASSTDTERVISLRTSPVKDEIKRPLSVKEEAKRLSGAVEGQTTLRVSPVRDEIKRPVSVKDEAKRFAQIAAEAAAAPVKPAKPTKNTGSNKLVDLDDLPSANSVTPPVTAVSSDSIVTTSTATATATATVSSVGETASDSAAFEKRASPEKVFATKINPGLAARMNKIDTSKIVMQMPGQSHPGRPKSTVRVPEESTENVSTAPVPTSMTAAITGVPLSALASGGNATTSEKTGEIVNHNMSRPTIDTNKSQRRKPQRKQFGGDDNVDPLVIVSPLPVVTTYAPPAYDPSVIVLPPLHAPKPKQTFLSKVVSWFTGSSGIKYATPSIAVSPAVTSAIPPQKEPETQQKVQPIISEIIPPPDESKRPVSQNIPQQSQSQVQTNRPISMALPPTQQEQQRPVSTSSKNIRQTPPPAQQQRPTSQKMDLSTRPPSKDEPIVVILPPPATRTGAPTFTLPVNENVIKDSRSPSDVMRELDLLPATSVQVDTLLTTTAEPSTVANPAIEIIAPVTTDITIDTPSTPPSTAADTTEGVKMTSRPASFSQSSNAPRNSRSLSKPIKVEEAVSMAASTALQTETNAGTGNVVVIDSVAESKPVEEMLTVSVSAETSETVQVEGITDDMI